MNKGTMKFLILFLSLALFIIGVHQTFVNGLHNSYWIYMFSLMLLFLYWYLKGPKKPNEQD